MKNLIYRKLRTLSCAWKLCLGLLLAFATVVGCGPSEKPNASNPSSSTSANSTPTTETPKPLMPAPVASTPTAANQVLSPAKALLKQVTAKYRNANTYMDKAIAVRRYVNSGKESKIVMPLAVAMRRPNQLSLVCYNVQMICDGKLVHGQIKDLVKDQDDFLELPAPEKITHENAVIDETMNYVLSVHMAGRPLQLLLLYSDDAYGNLLRQGEPTLLAEESVDGLVYQRIQFKSDDGTLVFWIEKNSQLIHRVDYPVEALRIAMEKQIRPVEQLEQYIDFRMPKIDSELAADTFENEVPKGAPLVKRLLTQPLPVRPMALLGKFSPDFEFVSLAGEKVSNKSLQGKITVLTFWDINPISRKYVGLVDQVREQFKTNEKVQFAAVSVDDEKIANSDIEKAMAEWKIQQPVVRDPKVDANKVLQIGIVPSLIVLDAEGKIQHHWPMLSTSLGDELPAILTQLLDGKPTFEATLKDYELRLDEYRRMQQTPPVDTSANASTNPSAPQPSQTKNAQTSKVPPVSSQKYRLTKLWEKPNSDQLKQPGNMVVVEDATVANGAARILVLDGWKAVCEYNLQGEQIARHEIQLPEKTAVSAIRTAIDGKGNRHFVLFHPFSPQIFVYDSNWKNILTYPTTEQLGTDMVTDCLLADVDGNDELEIAVGFSGTTGLHLLNLQGERIWANRAEAQYVIRIAATNPSADKKRKLLCTNSVGSVVPFYHEGKAGTPWFIPDQRIVRIFGPSSGETPWLVELNNSQGKNVVVGMGNDGIGRWHYILPDGSFERPVEPYTSAQLTKPDANEWLLAAPNATVQLLDSSGTLIDQFPTGSNVFGLAGLNREKKAILVYSNSAGITAQSLEPVESKASQK